MEIQTKKDITLSVKDVQDILFDHFTKEHRLNGDFNFDFVVINKPYPCGIHDVCDRHEFNGVKIVVTHD
jgi:hypothetical protein